MDGYRVRYVNSFPTKIADNSRQIPFRIIRRVPTVIGTNFAINTARPEMLPTAKWLGVRKKNTEKEAIMVPIVIII